MGSGSEGNIAGGGGDGNGGRGGDEGGGDSRGGGGRGGKARKCVAIWLVKKSDSLEKGIGCRCGRRKGGE